MISNPTNAEILKAIGTPITLSSNLENNIENPMKVAIPTGANITNSLIRPVPFKNVEYGVTIILSIV